MTEQLEGDLKRNGLVSQGKLSKRDSEEQAEEWEKVSVLLKHTVPLFVNVGKTEQTGSQACSHIFYS
jgi:hypothetical protein